MEIPTSFEWDAAKAASNERKHGLSFVEAAAIFVDPNRVVIDTARISDGEHRQKMIGRLNDRLFTVVFVMRGESCRLISARRANGSEVRVYDTG